MGGAGRRSRAPVTSTPCAPVVPVHERREFLGRLASAASRRATELRVLIVVDVDRLDDINAWHGVTGGDAVLEALGAALASGVDERAAVGRIDGDEFGVVCPVRSETAALALARRMLELASQPVEVGGRFIRPTTHAGVAAVAHGPDAVSESLRRAHAALAEAKRAPTPAPVLYRQGCAAERRAWIANALEKAMEAQELAMVYQPIVELPRRDVVGFEALLRWRTGRGVEVPPGEFVPVAEELGLIAPVGRWALDRAVAAAAAIDDGRRRRPRMAVNVSPRQLETSHFVTQIEDSLCAHGLDPSDLALEVTETELVANPRALAVLRSARRLGCRVGLDDFGTGYSCLGSLERLPLDFIKLDRSFLARLGRDSRSQRLVQATVSLAADLGLETVAEGVETEVQYRHVVDAGCSQGQGFLFGRPAPDIRWPVDGG